MSLYHSKEPDELSRKGVSLLRHGYLLLCGHTMAWDLCAAAKVTCLQHQSHCLVGQVDQGHALLCFAREEGLEKETGSLLLTESCMGYFVISLHLALYMLSGKFVRTGLLLLLQHLKT